MSTTDPTVPSAPASASAPAPASHERVMEVLADALELEPAQREEFLDKACAGHAGLRAEVERLLGREESAAQHLATQHSGKALLDALAPRQIGNYRILRMLGEGGMGIVYQAAQQAPVKRVVALKLIRPGMDSREVIARFESERQALALMSHPNVAHVYDAGTDDLGRPYFVMEYVAGEPITSYCDAHRLSVAQRLELFVQVCEAVQHAHQKGIIHRDLKPTNILVTESAGRAVPKVIDFGVAKAVQQALDPRGGGSGATLYTQRGQLIGTPEYMSPEQAHGHGIDIDTRSDIYSLGVILYELLTGTLPLDSRTLRDSGHQELQRMIREVDPPSPSKRLSSLQRETVDPAARARRTDATSLRRQIRGDLDWIVMRAMEKDRTRRYDGAGALADDVRRFMRFEPVLAGPPSTTYVLRKFARRHRTVLASGALLVVVLVAATILSGWLAVRARRAESVAVANEQRAVENERRAIENERLALENERKAREAATRSEQVAGFLSNMLQGVAPSVARGRDTTLLREILDKTAQRVGTDLKDVPIVEADLRTTLGRTYYGLGLYQQADDMWTESLRLRRQVVGEKHPDVAGAITAVGAARLALGDARAAEELFRQSLALSRELLGEQHMTSAEALNNLASALRAQGDLAGAEQCLRQTADIVEALRGPDEPRLATTLANLAGVVRMQGRFDDAEAPCRRALEIRRRVLGDSHPETANSVNQLGVLLQDRGEIDAAEPLLHEALQMRQRILGERHPDVSETLHNLARHYDVRQQHERAREYAQRATDIRRERFGENHPAFAQSMFELAHQHQAVGDIETAERYFRRVVDILERTDRRRDQYYALALQRVGRLMIDRDQFLEARQMYERTLAAYELVARPQRGDWRIEYTRVLIGGTLVREARQRGASPDDPALREAQTLMVENYEKMHTYPHVQPVSSRYAAEEMVLLYEALGQEEKAAEMRTFAATMPAATTRPTTVSATTRPAAQ